MVWFYLEVKESDGPFYPLRTEFSILGTLLIVICGIVMQGEIHK